MYRTLALACLLCLGLSSPAGAQTSPDVKAEAGQIGKLIEQLGDADYRKRDEAAARLRLEGPKALPALREAISHPDPEIRRRARDLAPALETAVLLAPKRVTLKILDKPLREVLDAITKQTGYKIDAWGSGNRSTYSFDMADVPFWEALDTVCQAGGMVLQQGYGDDRIRLHGQQGYVPYVRYEGPFRIVPTGFQHYRNIEFGIVGRGGATTARNESLTLSFTVFSEPKLPLLGIGEVRLEAAYDSEKNSMLIPSAGLEDSGDPRFGMRGRWISHYSSGNRMMSLQSQLTLNRASEKATGVKVIRGRLPVTLLSEQTPVVIAPDILKAKGVRSKVDSASFHIEEVTQLPNKNVQIKMTVSEATDNPNDYTWMNSLYQRVELQDDKGAKFAIVGNGWGNNSPGAIQMTTTFAAQGNKLGTPGRLIYYRWATLQHEIAFEFKDLPLP